MNLSEVAQTCRRGNAPPCGVACPLKLDIRKMMELLKNGSFAAAYRLYAKSALFPGITSHICDAPCSRACIRFALDGPLALRDLERYCWKRCHDTAAGSFFIPRKNKKILIVGGGLCGMACGAKLASRGYSVTLAEKSGRLGGRLWEFCGNTIPKDVLESDLERFSQMPYLEILLHTEISRFENRDFDATLVATGECGERIHAQGEEALENGGVLRAVGIRDEGRLDALRRGSEISFAVESFVKVGAVRLQQAPDTGWRPSVFATPNAAPLIPPVRPADPEAWTEEEVRGEAGRCLFCDCAGCLEECDMLRFY
ncbi:MAG: NAD(P)-binding protein, partial [Synergistaceae bacterium]|nr:NAD(P)-binding protein [Synergistaceae bacterium]